MYFLQLQAKMLVKNQHKLLRPNNQKLLKMLWHLKHNYLNKKLQDKNLKPKIKLQIKNVLRQSKVSKNYSLMRILSLLNNSFANNQQKVMLPLPILFSKVKTNKNIFLVSNQPRLLTLPLLFKKTFSSQSKNIWKITRYQKIKTTQVIMKYFLLTKNLYMYKLTKDTFYTSKTSLAL